MAGALKDALTNDIVTSGASGFAGPGRQQSFADHLAGNRRVLLHVVSQVFAKDRFDITTNFRVTELVLGLAFKLRVG